ncbi:MAG: DUF1579 family protein [Planctomycetota bacterium]
MTLSLARSFSGFASAVVLLTLASCGSMDPAVEARDAESTSAPILAVEVPPTQDPDREVDTSSVGEMPGDFAEQMAAAQRFTEPSDRHELLNRFVGDWRVQTSFVLGGVRQPAGPGGEMHCELVLGDRFLRGQSREAFVVPGAPGGEAMIVESELMLGHDNFKQSYVAMLANSGETAIRYAEGDHDPSSDQLICYGTLDEYLTGEHDKMVRYVWRFDGSERIVLEVHDLAIGANNTQVLEIEYRRKQN